MKIKVERPKCISCGSCVAVCPLYFELEESGLAHLKNSKKDAAENEELEVNDLGCARDAAEVCPVQIIKIED
jgi:ferredoxin